MITKTEVAVVYKEVAVEVTRKALPKFFCSHLSHFFQTPYATKKDQFLTSQAASRTEKNENR